jgi:hypothetical protein
MTNCGNNNRQQISRTTKGRTNGNARGALGKAISHNSERRCNRAHGDASAGAAGVAPSLRHGGSITVALRSRVGTVV